MDGLMSADIDELLEERSVIDDLLDAAVLEAALADGRSPMLAARQFGTARVIAAGPGGETAGARGCRSPFGDQWSAGDMEWLREWAGVLGDEEIAERLGRSTAAVKVRRIRRGLPGPTVHPDYLTAQGVAKVLGVDVHAVCRWIDLGLLAAELAPLADRKVWRVRRSVFYAWALRPENWVYFIRSVRRPERIRDARLRRLIVKRGEVWPDEWWSTGEAAEFHGVESTDVQRYIVAGRLPGVKYQNWWVLRSDVTRPGLRFFKGKGEGVFERNGSAAGDAFMVLASAVGIPDAHIERMMRRGAVGPRLAVIRKRGLVPWLARAYGLPVAVRADGEMRQAGAVWADWRPLAHRFRALERAWGRLGRGERITGFERRLLAGVLGAFMRFHRPEHPLTGKMHRTGMVGTEVLGEARGMYEEWYTF